VPKFEKLIALLMGRTHIPDPVKFFWEKGEMDFLVAIFRIHAEDRHVDG